MVLCLDDSEVNLSEGPFIVKRNTGEVHAVYRLYADTNHAFFEGTIHKRVFSGRLKTHSRVNSNKGHIVVPVPSRLYFRSCPKKPLSGLRFAVKDTIELKGFHTGYGSAAYRATYPPARDNAPCVKTLLDAGAIVVGIVKTTEFAEGTDPHEWLVIDTLLQCVVELTLPLGSSLNALTILEEMGSRSLPHPVLEAPLRQQHMNGSISLLEPTPEGRFAIQPGSMVSLGVVQLKAPST